MTRKQKPSYLINGDYSAGISPLDRGFAYGDGVFRTFRVEEGLPVKWPLHYQQLVHDCSAIDIVCPDEERLIQDLSTLFTDMEQCVGKIIITRGIGGRGYATPAFVAPNRVVIKSAMPSYEQSYYEAGVDLFLCETRLANQPQLAKIKHLNRLENVLARAEVNSDFFDGLVRDVEGHVVECTSANLFIRNGKTLYTSPLSNCGVAGVTRQSIINLASSLNFTVQEADFTLAQLFGADEVIISNSLYGAFQVKSVGEKNWKQQPLAEQIRIQLNAS